MMTITTDLDQLIIANRLIVLRHTGGEKGRSYGGRVITLRNNLNPVALRCTLAHEIAHCLAGDEPTEDAWLNARQERRADEFAARTLITTDSYREAEDLVGPHEGALAHELGVTTHLIRVWRELHERTPTQ